MEYINPYKKFNGAMIPNWLLRRKEISSGAKLCYARLCQHAGKDGKCFPKQATLAQELGCSTRTISRYIKELLDHKLIASIRLGKRCSNRYLFCKHEWMEFRDQYYLELLEDPFDEKWSLSLHF